MKIIRNYFFVIGLIAGLAAAANAQKLIYGGAPKAAPKTAATESFFAQLPGKIRVYKVQDDAGEDRQTYFEIRDAGKPLGKLDASINAFGGSLGEFFAFYGDLDKNKAAELVVVDYDGQSLGLGVNYYTINIFPDFQTKGFTDPLTFKTAEFGKDGTFRYDPKSNETLILLTEWGGVQIKDASNRGADGVYFTGRYFRYENGRLKPAAGKPILARRYLNSFQKERFRTDKSPLRPYNWLSSAQTLKLKGDPVFDEKPDSSEPGTIEKFETVTETYKSEDGEDVKVSVRQIVVRLDSGATKTIVVARGEFYDRLPENPNRLVPEAFGVLPAKFSLPTDFSPLLVFDNPVGKKVRLVSYKFDADSDPIYKLWFVE